MLIQHLTDYCDNNFRPHGNCGKNCTHPSEKCTGSCGECLHEIQFHRVGGRTEYNCQNMLRYYTCHTIWKRASEILYALETADLRNFSEFRVLSIGCGAAPDLMAIDQIADGRPIQYHGVDIEPVWDEIHGAIEWHAGDIPGMVTRFENRDVYEMFAVPNAFLNPYNAIVLQYMIAGHIYTDRAEKIDLLFDEIIDKLISHKQRNSPFLMIINDIDHKSWICDYFNLFTRKLRARGFSFKSEKRHFEPREDGENAGSKLYKSRGNRFLEFIPKNQRDTYNAHAPCSAAQLIVEVT